MSTSGIKNIVEALIFASDEEITAKEIKDLLDNFKIAVSIKEVEASIDELNSDYEKNSTAFEIIKLAGGYVFATRKKFSHFLGKLSAETQRKKLSQSAIETLAIIAYKQPITRSEIEFIRGVNVDYIVNSLLERDLITIKGRADGPGRPILYGTTASFLKVLGLNALEDLPKLKEINDILKNEKIEGISEADIDLFNSMSIQAQAELSLKKDNNEEENSQLNFKEENKEIASEEHPENEEIYDEFEAKNYNDQESEIIEITEDSDDEQTDDNDDEQTDDDDDEQTDDNNDEQTDDNDDEQTDDDDDEQTDDNDDEQTDDDDDEQTDDNDEQTDDDDEIDEDNKDLDNKSLDKENE